MIVNVRFGEGGSGAPLAGAKYALQPPIHGITFWACRPQRRIAALGLLGPGEDPRGLLAPPLGLRQRSEERRVGKEC